MLKNLIILFCILCSNSFSDVLDISDSKNPQALNYITFINDSKNIYTYEDINNKTNLEILHKFHIGGSIGPFWTKLKLTNNSSKIKSITLFNPLAGINKIDVYLIKNDKLEKTLYLGDYREQNLRDSLTTYSSFNLVLNPNDSYTVISKIENFYIYNLGWEILKSTDFFTQDSHKIFSAGIISGLVLLFCLYNILNFYLYKNSSYLIICTIAFSLVLYQLGFHGILYFLDMNLELINFITWNMFCVGGIFLLVFALIFFEQRKKYKIYFFINLFFIFSYICLIVLLTYGQFIDESYFNFSWLISPIVLFSTLYLFSFAVIMAFKKEIGAKYYLLGEGILLVAIFLNTLGLFNIVPYLEMVKFLIPVAYIINIILLVIALYIKTKTEQENFKKAKILLLEQSRFNSIGQAVGHISHQWKNPLTKIGTSITLLETIYNHNNIKFTETFEKQLPLIKKSIVLMKKSIGEFSNFYKTQNKKEEFKLHDSISNIVEILSSKITLKHAKVNLRIDENFKIISFEHILSNIFLILIDNSLDEFLERKDNFIEISVKQEKKHIIITYKDNAGGIKIKPIDSIFDYFVSEKENKKSSGIGLAVAKMLVKDRLNGEIKVENDKDGAVFTIII